MNRSFSTSAATSGMYTRSLFELQREQSRRSARAVVPLVLDVTGAQVVVDVGCGVGTWLRAFADLGVADYLGLDGEHVEPDMLEIDAAHFQASDLRQRIVQERRFDLACSVEVAEHLPADRAESFVADLVKLAPFVLFSAAVPEQGGPGHINERPQSYWAALFERHDYWPLDLLRPAIWDNAEVMWWYRQNLLLYVHRDHLPAGYVRPKLLDVSHPQHVSALRKQLAQSTELSGLQALAALARALGRRLGWR